ncbi:cell division protein ZapA [Agathobaculum butyriciproducens]|nr:cell division protein ZapA [Agathobaculum butyriciproducens]RGC57926.1 cell division protein ZapA [Agathobaculum butyriciproducens]RGM78932.1 cell division protein ZapA [Butyricicoccus sp. OM06-6AC]RHV74005.1 cell division protein ZapA [Butyricicoccus sp. OF13-6]
MPKFDSTAFQRRCPHIYYNERKGPVMANRMVLHIAGQKYNLVSDESADYMNEVAELARQTVAHCGGSPSFASTRALALATVTLADDYIKPSLPPKPLRQNAVPSKPSLPHCATGRRRITASTRITTANEE